MACVLLSLVQSSGRYELRGSCPTQYRFYAVINELARELFGEGTRLRVANKNVTPDVFQSLIAETAIHAWTCALRGAVTICLSERHSTKLSTLLR